jgi:Tol biopolymer transport system component
MPAAGQPTGQLTPDGTYATFSSPARDLVAGGTMGDQVFLYNQTTQATELVSSTSAGSEADGEYSVAIGLSSDGRYNLFASDSPALGSDAGCATTVGGGYGVFVKDMQTGELECLSGSSVGATAESISGNGQYVVFQYAGQVYLATLF